MTPERLERVRTVLERRQPDLTVLLDNVHKPHNFSAILRSCDAVGVLEAHAVWPHERLRPMNHTSGGSARWVSVRTHPTLRSAVEVLHRTGFCVIAAHVSDEARDYRDVDYTEPCALVLGAELTGLSDEAVALADRHVAIPMTGMVRSLNVSVAAAVILFEAQRQRLLAGHYAQLRLDPDTYRRRLFEWLHPETAAHCRERDVDYPALTEEGDIADLTWRR